MATYDSDVILLEGDDDDVLYLGIKPKNTNFEIITINESEAENSSGEEKEIKEKNQVGEKKMKGKKGLESDGNEADDEAEDYKVPPSPPHALLHHSSDDESERDEDPPSPPHPLPGSDPPATFDGTKPTH